MTTPRNARPIRKATTARAPQTTMPKIASTTRRPRGLSGRSDVGEKVSQNLSPSLFARFPSIGLSLRWPLLSTLTRRAGPVAMAG
nr:hypothetical protein [Herbidospora yilanensis]